MTEDPIAGCKREGAMVPGVPRSGNHRRGAEDAETSAAELLEAYPGLTAEDVRAAISYPSSPQSGG
jgi:hypothetical protein